MSWQDGLLFIGSIVLGLSLWPSIRGKDKPALKTSFVQTAILASYGIAYVTLGLWGAAAGIAINTLGWLVLLVQKVHIKRQPRRRCPRCRSKRYTPVGLRYGFCAECLHWVEG